MGRPPKAGDEGGEDGNAMKNVLLVGGGKIGVAITEFLTQSGDYKVTVDVRDPASLARMPMEDNVTLREIDILSRDFFCSVEGHDIVLSAKPNHMTSKAGQA